MKKPKLNTLLRVPRSFRKMLREVNPELNDFLDLILKS